MVNSSAPHAMRGAAGRRVCASETIRGTMTAAGSTASTSPTVCPA